MGSLGEPNGIDFVSLEGWVEGVRQTLEFRERGVEEPLSRRRSKLVPWRAICERDLSLDASMALGPWSSGRVEESSVSSATGEPDERLCIGGGGVGTHPAGQGDTFLAQGAGGKGDGMLEEESRRKRRAWRPWVLVGPWDLAGFGEKKVPGSLEA